MAISFACGCGKTLRVADEHAGKRVKCPVCQNPVLVPAAVAAAPAVARPVVARPVAARPVQATPPAEEAGFEVVDDDEPVTRSKRRRSDDDDDEPASRRSRRRSDDDDDRPSRRSRRDADDEDDEDDEKPRKRRKGRLARKRERRKDASTGMRMLYIFGGILGVVVGCAIAYYAWDSEARRVGKVIGLGIVLAIAGISGMFKGITGNIESSSSSEDDDEDE